MVARTPSILAAWLFLAFAAAPAAADPVTVTGGFAVVNVAPIPSILLLLTDGNDVFPESFGTLAGGAESGLIVTARLPRLVTGELAGLSTTASWSSGDGGLTGDTPVRVQGRLNFVAGNTTLDCNPAGDDINCRGAAPFRFSGAVSGFAAESSVPLFAFDLSGSGQASGLWTSGRNAAPLSAFYVFHETASPIPEPAAVVMVGSGLAVLLRMSRRRQQRVTPGTPMDARR